MAPPPSSILACWTVLCLSVCSVIPGANSQLPVQVQPDDLADGESSRSGEVTVSLERGEAVARRDHDDVDDMGVDDGATAGPDPIKLKKCCGAHEVYDLVQGSCVRWEVDDLQVAAEANPIRPAFIEDDAGNETTVVAGDGKDHDDDDDGDDYLGEGTGLGKDIRFDRKRPFTLTPPGAGHGGGLPECQEGSEARTFLLNPEGGGQEYGAFGIDTYYDPPMVVDTERVQLHRDFCLERAVRTIPPRNSKPSSGHLNHSGSALLLVPLLHQQQQQEQQEHVFLGTVALVCRIVYDVACRTRTCVRSCCDPPTVFDPDLGTCRPAYGEDERIVFMPKIAGFAEKGSSSEVIFMYGRPSCPKGAHMYNFSSADDVVISSSGEFSVGTGAFGLDEYCVGHVERVVDASAVPAVLEYWEQVTVCIREDAYSQGYLRWVRVVDLILVPALFIVSIVFLAVLFCHEVRRNRQHQRLFGALKLCAMFMLLVFYSVVTAVKLAGPRHVKDHPAVCVFQGLIIQFCYLSAVCWLNAMSIDVWSNFRKVRVNRELTDPRRRRATCNPSSESAGSGVSRVQVPLGFRHKRFKWYALYSLGLPCLVTVVTVLMQFLPPKVTAGAIRPGIGESRCFLEDHLPTLVYFYLINGPVLFANLVLFCVLIWNICFGIWSERSGDPALNRSGGSAVSSSRRNVVFFLKMFFTLGLTWICEIISWSVEWTFGRTSLGLYQAMTVFKVINALQGFIMFCVIFFDATNIDRLRGLLGRRPQRRDAASSGPNTTTTTRTSVASSAASKSGTKGSEKRPRNADKGPHRVAVVVVEGRKPETKVTLDTDLPGSNDV